MLLVESPREAAVPPCALDLPMSALTKLNFTDYSVKLKPYDSPTERDSRLNYEQALSAARLGYEQSVTSPKLQYDQIRPFDQLENMCPDPAYALTGNFNDFHRYRTTLSIVLTFYFLNLQANTYSS